MMRMLKNIDGTAVFDEPSGDIAVKEKDIDGFVSFVAAAPRVYRRRHRLYGILGFPGGIFDCVPVHGGQLVDVLHHQS